jgi:hypothetical protein
MPVLHKKDKEDKCYVQWGNQTKYYYPCKSDISKENAERKAIKQGAIIESRISQKYNNGCCSENEHKDLIVEYLENNDVCISFEELGITEEDVYNTENFSDVTEQDIIDFEKDGEEQFASLIKLYRYVSDKYGSSNIGPDTRPFCKQLVRRTSAAMMPWESITNMNGMNPGFGKDGGSSYSVFNYRGGKNCVHKWVKYLYDPENMNIVKSPKQPTQDVDAEGGVPGAPKPKPKTK